MNAQLAAYERNLSLATGRHGPNGSWLRLFCDKASLVKFTLCTQPIFADGGCCKTSMCRYVAPPKAGIHESSRREWEHTGYFADCELGHRGRVLSEDRENLSRRLS